MSEKNIKLEITGQIKGFRTTLSLETMETSLSHDIKLLINLLEKAGASPAPTEEPSPVKDEPIKQLASEVDADPSTLRSLIGYKEGMIQISKASQLQVTDAMCMLLYAYEKGFGESAIAFEQFESLVRQNGIKFTYPLTTGIFNLKKSGYINGKLYDEEKKLSLSPQGEENARSAFKDYIAGKGTRRTSRVSKRTRNVKRQQGSVKKKT